MECSAQSVVRKSHLVAKQRLCFGLIVTIVMLGCIHTVYVCVCVCACVCVCVCICECVVGSC